jgi:hypothetical protein
MLCARRRRMHANLVDHAGKLARGEWFRNANCGAVTTSNRGQLRAGQSDYLGMSSLQPSSSMMESAWLC